jgi:hypothetical protein
MQIRQVACAVLCFTSISTACAADYVPAHCKAVADTLNIFWQSVAGVETCTAIEYTDGTFADTVDGTFSMTGTATSNVHCFSTGAYTFTRSADKLSLVGSDTKNNVSMTLTLSADGACYVGHWVSGPYDYVATIWAVAAQGLEIYNSSFEPKP